MEMIHKNIIVASLLLASLTTAAQTINVHNATAVAGNEMELTIEFDNDIANYIAAGAFLQLPDGFSVSGVEVLKGYFLQSDHVAKAGITDNNRLRLAIYSPTNSAFSFDDTPTVGGDGQSGGSSGGRMAPRHAPAEQGEDIAPCLCRLKLTAPSKTGTFTGKLTGLELSTAPGSLVRQTDASFSITVTGNGTNINSIDSTTDNTNQSIYNVSGQQLEEPQHGVNIIKSKKVLVK